MGKDVKETYLNNLAEDMGRALAESEGPQIALVGSDARLLAEVAVSSSGPFVINLVELRQLGEGAVVRETQGVQMVAQKTDGLWFGHGYQEAGLLDAQMIISVPLEVLDFGSKPNFAQDVARAANWSSLDALLNMSDDGIAEMLLEAPSMKKYLEENK